MVNIARVFSNSRKQLAQAINPDKAAQPKRRVRSKTAEFQAFANRQKNQKLFKELYLVYENGAEIAQAIDTYALFTVSNEPKIMADEEDDKKALELWWNKIDGVTFLQNAVKWSLVFGNAIFEKVPNVIGTKIVDLKYMDGRSVILDDNEFGELEQIRQIWGPIDEPTIFKPDKVVNICMLKGADGVHGISLINRNLDNIKRKVKVDEGITSYIHRHGFPKYHIRVKPVQEGMPVPDEVLGEHEKVFENINSQNEFVTDDKVEILAIDQEGKTAVKEFSEWAMTLITAGLGVPEELLGLGRGSTEATAKVRMKAFEHIISAFRHMLNKQVQLQLFEPMREQLGLSKDGKLWLEFPDINPQDEAAKAEWISKIMPQVRLTTQEATPEEIERISPLTRDEVREQMGMGKHPASAKKGAELSMCTCGQHQVNVKELQAPAKKRPEDERQRLTERYQMPLRPVENRLISNLISIFAQIEEEFLERVKGIAANKEMQKPVTPLQEGVSLAIEIDVPVKYRGAIEKALLETMEESFAIGGIAALEAIGKMGIPALTDAEAIAWLDIQAKLVSNETVDKAILRMRYELMEGFRKGESVTQVSDRLSGVFEASRKDLDRIARTEIQRAANEGRLSGYQQAGIEKVEFLVTMDDRTCAQCLAFDGNIMTISEARNLIPLHPNCRCTYMPVEAA